MNRNWKARFRRSAGARRFLADRRGATAVEMALLIAPFTLLVFSVLESCVAFAAQEVMANATYDVGRMIFAGQVKAAEIDETKLKSLLCDRMTLVVPAGCPGLVVDLRSYATFADAAAQPIKLTADRDLDTTGFAVKPGAGGSKNMLRVFYKWPVMTNIVATMTQSTLKDNKMLEFSSFVWQSEPF